MRVFDKMIKSNLVVDAGHWQYSILCVFVYCSPGILRRDNVMNSLGFVLFSLESLGFVLEHFLSSDSYIFRPDSQ